jgi:hypothetical protein
MGWGSGKNLFRILGPKRHRIPDPDPRHCLPFLTNTGPSPPINQTWWNLYFCYYLLNFRNLDIMVTVKDSQGRTFDSIETLQVDWTLSDSGLASLAQPKGTLSQVPVPSLRTFSIMGSVAVHSRHALFWIRICRIRKFLGLTDLEPDTLVGARRYGSGSFSHQAKIVRKTVQILVF